ncbi:hypothetical protein [Campylobacter sp. 19-13652]|uniref:hypothetical protein n=1 Tax=Campylobacter sp. 19-13652 TaxID=2840180 RepID=UPI001C7915FC|nr:hypothetical protein [Campylobacter sp. 19-13652]BCX79329.1 hypothetical protein LBC_07910 [Campylobacter sp. 19-13652]
MSELLLLQIAQNAKIYSDEILVNPNIIKLLLANASSRANEIDAITLENCKECIKSLNLIISKSQLSSNF